MGTNTGVLLSGVVQYLELAAEGFCCMSGTQKNVLQHYTSTSSRWDGFPSQKVCRGNFVHVVKPVGTPL